PALLVTERQQSAGLLEPQTKPLVVSCSARQLIRCLIVVFPGQAEDGDAPRGGDARPRVPLARREQAQPLCHCPGALVLVALCERFYQVSGDRKGAGLVHLLAHRVVPDGTEQISRLLWLPREQRGDPGRTGCLEPVPAKPGRLTCAR